MMDEGSVRERARDLVERGIVSTPVPRRAWVGRSTGHDCLLCQQRIAADQIECEVEFAQAVTGHLHRRCFDLLLDETGQDGLKQG